MHALVVALLAAAPLTTLSEESGWTKTGRYEEVERLCTAFAKRYPTQVKCERFGTTPLGRPMLMLVASGDGVFTPALAAKKRRPVVLMQGGIHAGEIDGKDAGFWLLREVLEGRAAKGALSKVTWLFVPVFNVDGHERFGVNQRPNQRGPEEMGWRVTASNLNLNRDYAKADAPEMRAMLTLLHAWNPVLYVDLHVTDGAKFQHDVSLTFEPRRLGPESLAAQGRALKDAVFTSLTDRGHLPVDFYPSFVDADDPASGFESGWPPPRFGNAYWALHHRFGVLVETHSWRPYAHRVKTTYDVCEALLNEAATHGAEWLAAASLADAVKRGGVEVPMLYAVSGEKRTIEFQGYAYTRAKSDLSDKFWVQYDEATPQVWKVPLRDGVTPKVVLTAPRAGYVVAAPYADDLAPRLTAHGLKFERFKKSQSLAVERFTGAIALKSNTYEGRTVGTVTGAWSASSEDFTPGALFVPVDQPGGALVMHLFEPTLPDSFAAWGFFNAHFEQKEYLEDYLTEVFARDEIKRHPALKAEFDAKLKDPAFAKSPDARLAFFAKRHPSFDARLGVLPVFRVDVSPASK